MKKTAEGKYLKKDASNYDSGAYEKPSVTVDVAICTIVEEDIKVLLIRRKYPPFQDLEAIPGGFLEIKRRESLEDTAARELKEETGLDNIYFEQLKTYGDPDRDPRERVITIAYFALLPNDCIPHSSIKANDDAAGVGWFSLRNPPSKLAFDHKLILSDLLERLIGKVSYTPIIFSLVPKRFTWSGLQGAYEVILNKKLIPANFRRKIKAMYKIKTLNSKKKPALGRPSPYLKYVGSKDNF